MKIYRLHVSDSLRPETQGMNWPPDSDDFGCEQDFDSWLNYSDYLTDDLADNLAEADWLAFLPYWNRHFWQYPDERHNPNGELQQAVSRAVWYDKPVFTIAEYGPIGEQPELNFDGLTIFSASRRGDTREIDIPLLLYSHAYNPIQEQRPFLASFAGNFANDPVRWQTFEALNGKPGVYFADKHLGIHQFVEVLQSAYIALAPRGVGVQSFRFYEAMQVGTVPLLISDVDSRPFKKWVDWDSCSLYLPSHEGIYEFMQSFSLQELTEMGKNAQRVYYEQLAYGKWCKYVIMTLEEMG